MTWTSWARSWPSASTISSKDSPRPTISPDLVTTSSPPISLAVCSTRSERSHVEPRRAIEYRRGTTSQLWLKTSGRSAMTLASGMSSPWKSGVRTSILHLGAWRRIWRMTPTKAWAPLSGMSSRSTLRDDRVAQAHARDLAGDARGLQRVVPGRLAGLDVAEAAAARARVAEDHERRGAALPALADVRAGGLLAHGVQVVVGDLGLELAVLRPAGHRDLEPLGLALADVEDVGSEDLQDVHPARVGARAGLVLALLRRRFGGHRRP